MKKLMLVIALLMLCFAPALAQEPQEGPEHFIWMGGGVDRYAPADEGERLATGVFGYGHRIAGNSYMVTNVVMTERYSTLSEAFLQRITQQGPVSLYALGELGIETGSETTNLSIGGGMAIDVGLGFLHARLKNFGLVMGLKLLKDNAAEISNAVKPRFLGGISYSFGK